jgi:hypothetical protein
MSIRKIERMYSRGVNVGIRDGKKIEYTIFFTALGEHKTISISSDKLKLPNTISNQIETEIEEDIRSKYRRIFDKLDKELTNRYIKLKDDIAITTSKRDNLGMFQKHVDTSRTCKT